MRSQRKGNYRPRKVIAMNIKNFKTVKRINLHTLSVKREIFRPLFKFKRVFAHTGKMYQWIAPKVPIQTQVKTRFRHIYLRRKKHKQRKRKK